MAAFVSSNPPAVAMLFRVHFADGQKLHIEAVNAEAARKAARAQHDAPIAKIKIVKEQG